MAATLIGFRCDDFVMVAATGTAAHYYIKLMDNDDTIATVDDGKLLALSGENGDRVNFAQLISRNLALQRVRAHGRPSTTPAVANYIRTTLAEALRQGPYQVQSLFAGFDKAVSEHDDDPAGAKLYYLDYLGTMEEVPFAAHGYGATFAMALLDEKWRSDLTPQQGVDLMQQCLDEVKKRVILSNEHFVVKCATPNGVEVITTVS
uniref:Proteasome subunit beta n=1 Tax=Neobodo designis TaxID=312471 RepID=A0A7S1WAZ7_NEODS|mmetsp:Transcript_9870/g.30464  ORF Transcript_9870/g.30464 Transcript_9870/m.30464 type:complete len:205 (+) Transcript_9870:55-669(+)|eukprot:CAMPEP_0174850574 /NCGR_PEP_ID=MMETSP1114-20130205/20088_1 /TAXON_ID=312471 /ORGANISM="Neobodo designis, Strain CCAP 1951/1" /LENGTH=204 /DNA_ID=CAMNT_0016085041 /DNA_START=55 /DNA_END=669 /DNA_ORIENTATION=+